MVKKCVSRVGDTWDLIAWREMGSCAYTEKLIDANRDKIETFIFSDGVELVVPEIDNSVKKSILPAWRA